MTTPVPGCVLGGRGPVDGAKPETSPHIQPKCGYLQPASLQHPSMLGVVGVWQLESRRFETVVGGTLHYHSANP